MKSQMKRWMMVMLVALMAGVLPQAWGEAPEEKPVDKEAARAAGLKVRQEKILSMVREFETKLVKLADELKETEPEHAAKLKRAYDTSRERGIGATMSEVVKLLNEKELSKASDKQKQAAEEITRLIILLTREDTRLDEMRDELEELEKIQQELQRLLDRETDLREESDRILNKDQVLRDLEAQIRALEELIKAQRGVNEKGRDAVARGVHAMGRVADEQRQTRQATEKLARDVSGKQPGGEQPGSQGGSEQSGSEGSQNAGSPSGQEGSAGEQSGSEQQSGGVQSGGEQSGGEQSGGEQSGGEQSGGEQSGGEQSGGQQSGGQQSGGQQSGGQQSGGQQSGGQQSGGQQSGGEQQGSREAGSPQAGEQPLNKAIESQRQAEAALGKGMGKQAREAGAEAERQLGRALEELKKERDRIARLPEDHAEKELSKEQGDVADETGKTADRMAKGGEQSGGEQSGGQQSEGEQSGGQQSGGQQSGGQQSGGQQSGGQQSGGQQSGGQQSPQQQRAQQHTQQAQQNMKKAQQSLKKNQTEQARKDQQQAIRDLERAMQEIEERLAQLRREMQDELLANLEMRFQQMLEAQIPLTRYTEALGQLDGAWSARQYRIDLPARSNDQRAIAAMAQRALDIIKEDGTTVIFPRVVEQLRDDMEAASGLIKGLGEQGEKRALAKGETANQLAADLDRNVRYTHNLQLEIEQTLRELIEAVQKAQEQQEQQQSQGQSQESPGQEQRDPLVPDSAELKLLKAAQLRVNSRTEIIDGRRAAQPAEDAMSREVGRVAEQQRTVADMAQEMIERK